MPKLSLEDLKAVREKARAERRIGPGGPYRAKITVHMGTCGIAAGARGIMEAFLTEIDVGESDDIFLTTSGCAGYCSHEPMATVELSGTPPVKYIDLDPDKARKIYREHVIGTRPVRDFALASGSERSI